jgi:hypothetical protein
MIPLVLRDCRRLVVPLVFLGLAWSSVAPRARADDGPTVTFRAEPGLLKIEVGGKPFATYVFRDETITRPYFAHVQGPRGVQVTRNHPPVEGRDPVDHATMHPGIWLAFGDLSGSDDWRNRARVEHDRFVEAPAGGPGKGVFTVANRYLAKDGTTLCRETCRYSVLVRPSGYLLTSDSEFRSDSAELVFGDQEEMGFGVRVATPLAVKSGGRLVNSDGLERERGVWGRAADWCDYSGVVEGRRTGVTLMPDPKNFRRSWFHARDYGLLVANPFGRKAFHQGEASRVVAKPGTSFRLGFAVLVHDAPVAEEIDLAAAYRDYLGLAAPGEPPPTAGPKP